MGWTEERSTFRSSDLPTYLRLMRLVRVLEGYSKAEGLDGPKLAEDLGHIIAHIRHGQALPGNPNRID